MDGPAGSSPRCTAERERLLASLPFDPSAQPEKLRLLPARFDQCSTFRRRGRFRVLARTGNAPVVWLRSARILTGYIGGTHQRIIVLGGLAEVRDKGPEQCPGGVPKTPPSMQDLDRAGFPPPRPRLAGHGSQAFLPRKKAPSSTAASHGSIFSKEHPAATSFIHFNCDALKRALPDGPPFSPLCGEGPFEFRENPCAHPCGRTPRLNCHPEIGQRGRARSHRHVSIPPALLAVARRPSDRSLPSIASCERQRAKPFLYFSFSALAAEFAMAGCEDGPAIRGKS